MNVNNKIIAWNIVYELMQRSTESLSLMTLHPGGGQYNCLTILRSFDEEPQMLINLNGTSVHVGKDNDLIHSYPELYNQNKEDLINKIAKVCGYDLAEKPVRDLVVIEFFIKLIEQGMDVTSAWLDSSYDNHLSDAARNFPSYPIKDVRDSRKHWAWW